MSDQLTEDNRIDQPQDGSQVESQDAGRIRTAKKSRIKLYLALAAALITAPIGYGQYMNYQHNKTQPTQEQLDGEFDGFIHSPEEVLEKIKKEKEDNNGGSFSGDATMA